MISITILVISVDVQELFYSLPHKTLVASVKSCIEKQRELSFRNLVVCLKILSGTSAILSELYGIWVEK